MTLQQRLEAIQADTQALGFAMGSDAELGRLLCTLAASKPAGRLLELGTGTGLATAWLLAGMDAKSRLISVDNDPQATAVAQKHLGHDARLSIYTEDGLALLQDLQGQHFDLIFADTWPGKIDHPELALNLVAPGGFYVIDDLKLAWQEAHEIEEPSDFMMNVWRGQRRVMQVLEQQADFVCVSLQWSTGLMIATRKQ